MSSPLISIVIPSFQQGNLLADALKSIEQQAFKDYEVLVLDAVSKDNTHLVIEEFAHLPLKFFSEPDKGIYDAMNKGVERSSGEYLYFMGCDDRLASPFVLQEVFGSNKNILNNHVIYGDVIFSDNNVRYDGKFDYFKLIKQNICHQAIFTHRKVFDTVGGFNIGYTALADWEFNMRWFGMDWVKRCYIPVVIAVYSNTGFSADLQDAAFFADEAKLKRVYFPKIVRYLSSNLDKPLHYRLTKLMTFERINFFKRIYDLFKI